MARRIPFALDTTTWTNEAIVLSEGPELKTAPWAVSDDSGGVIVTWSQKVAGADDRSFDLFAQRLRADGTIAGGWPARGVPICEVDGYRFPAEPVGDGEHGAIIAWNDDRTGKYETYVQRVTAQGVAAPDVPEPPPPAPPAGFRLDRPRPQPMSATALVPFELPTPAQVVVRIFDLRGRVVRRLQQGRVYPAGTHAVAWDGRNDDGLRLPPGIYVLHLKAGLWSASTKIVLYR
jgi:hypothetical protein